MATAIDRATKTVTQTIDTPDSTSNGVSISVNGLLVKQSSPTVAEFASFEYDGLGRQLQVINADGTKTSQTYNAQGRVETQTDAALNKTTITYCAQDEYGAGQPKTVTYADGKQVTYEYNALGARIKEAGGATYPVDYDYNNYGERTKMYTYRETSSVGNKPQGDLTTWAYDEATGRLESKTDAAGKKVNYQYYPNGTLKSRVWARGVSTTYVYNNAGDLTSVDYSDTTPDVNLTISRSGQPSTVVDGSGSSSYGATSTGLSLGYSYTTGLLNGFGVSYGYDGFGRMETITAAGRLTQYSYRTDGRLGTVSHQGSLVTYDYKPSSDLIKSTTVTHGGGTRLTTVRNYDTANRIDSVVNTSGSGAVMSRSYTYNNRNQRTEAKLPNGEYWFYGYNDKGEVTSGQKRKADATALIGHDYNYAFDEIGNRKETVINGKQSIYARNALNQYDSRTILPFVEILGSADPSATVTINNQPTQRQDGLFFKQIPVDNSTNSAYTTNMIVGVRNNADPQGNDAVQQSTVKRVVVKNPESFSYDFDGNLLSDGRFNYTWDGENRLIRVESVTSAPSAEKKRVDLQYDSQSRRVSKKVYSWDGSAWALQDSRRFLNDQFNIVAEINDSGAVINSYAWGTDLSGSIYGAGGVGGLLIVSSGASAHSYPSFDGNGNSLGYTNASGVVVAELEYSPFGEVIRATGSVPCAFGFSTKYKDAETGLNYYGYRYYSAGLGRWINRDPIGEEGGINLLALNGNDAIDYWDYLGQETVSVVYWTLIESPTITFARRTFKGGVKTVHGFKFDTVSRNMTPNFLFVGETIEFDKTGKVIGRGRASGSSLKVKQSKNETCLVEFEMTGNERNPLATFAPAITYKATITFDYKKMMASVGGTDDSFPSHALMIKGHVVYSYSNRLARSSPLGLFDFGMGINQKSITGASTPFKAK